MLEFTTTSVNKLSTLSVTLRIYSRSLFLRMMFLTRVEQVSNRGRGRPRFDVSKEQLEFLLERGFSVPAVAQILGISVRTTERRLQEFGISATQLFTLIDDQTLDRTIEDILRSFPSSGYWWMTGYLLRQGIRVQQVHIRESVRRVDPEGVLLMVVSTYFKPQWIIIW